MSKHDEFPTKPDYEAISESLEAENAILQRQVALQTKRLEDLQQAVKDALTEIKDEKGFNFVKTGYVAFTKSIDILTEKTGITA